MKTGLALSGGGAKGAFQYGALEVLAEHGYTYDHISAVSVGALNGVMISAGKLERMGEIWRSVTDKQVYAKRTLPKLAGGYLLHWLGLRKPPLGIYSNEPLLELLRDEFNDIDLKIPLTVGRVDLITGEYITDINPDTQGFVLEILASTAIPVIWDPVKLGEGLFVDGGVRNIAPVYDVVKERPDKLVVITTEPRKKPSIEKTLKNIIDVAERSLNIVLDEVFRGDLEHCFNVNELVKQAEAKGVQLTGKDGEPLNSFEMVLIEPPETLGGTLNFDRKRLDELIEMGREAAKEVL